MALETGTYISDLVITNPVIGDDVGQGDDHLRLVKATLKTTFPNVTGAVTPTHTQLNYVAGVTSALQTQLDAKAPLASPALTGTPTVPTATAGTNTTQIASTAFVRTEVAAGANPGTWASLSNQVIVGAASVAFTQFTSTLYDNYKILVTDLYGSLDAATIYVATSTNAGSSYDSGATDYAYYHLANSYSGTSTPGNGTSSTVIILCNQLVSSTASNASCLEINVFKPSAATKTSIVWFGENGYSTLTGFFRGAGTRNSATGAVNAIRLAASGGTLTGTFRLYGQYK